MSLENNEKEIETTLEQDEDYDEDLAELFNEESPVETTNQSLKNDEEDNEEVMEEKYKKITNEEIESNISSYLLYGDIVQFVIIVLAIIVLVAGLISTEGQGGLLWIIISIAIICSGLLSSMMIKWFGYVLKCLYDIKMK